MGKKILWLDNDEADIDPLVKVLRRADHEVTTATMMSQAWSLLAEEVFDLLILDVMIPTRTEEEEAIFPPIETHFGHLAGLCFYTRLVQDPARNRLPVLVFTIRRDAEVFEVFKKAGLPPDCFGGKFELRRVQDFLRKVEEVMQKHHAAAAPSPER